MRSLCLPGFTPATTPEARSSLWKPLPKAPSGMELGIGSQEPPPKINPRKSLVHFVLPPPCDWNDRTCFSASIYGNYELKICRWDDSIHRLGACCLAFATAKFARRTAPFNRLVDILLYLWESLEERPQYRQPPTSLALPSPLQWKTPADPAKASPAWNAYVLLANLTVFNGRRQPTSASPAYNHRRFSILPSVFEKGA